MMLADTREVSSADHEPLWVDDNRPHSNPAQGDTDGLNEPFLVLGGQKRRRPQS